MKAHTTTQEALPGMSPAEPKDRKWRSAKVRLPLAQAEKMAKVVTDALDAAGLEHHLGGSLRRREDTIGDIDVIVVCDGTSSLPEIPGFQLQKGKDVVWQGDLTVDGVTMHLDIWTLQPHQLGAYLWYATGPKDLNVEMRRVALKKGMHLKQMALEDEAGNQLDDGTEEGVARVLGWPMMTPEERKAWSKKRTGVVTHTTVTGSKGDKYVLTLTDGVPVACTCPGYHFRQHCKHLSQTTT